MKDKAPKSSQEIPQGDLERDDTIKNPERDDTIKNPERDDTIKDMVATAKGEKNQQGSGHHPMPEIVSPPLAEVLEPIEDENLGSVPLAEEISNPVAVADTLECDAVPNEEISSSLAEVLEPSDDKESMPPESAVLLNQAMADTIEARLDLPPDDDDRLTPTSVVSSYPGPQSKAPKTGSRARTKRLAVAASPKDTLPERTRPFLVRLSRSTRFLVSGGLVLVCGLSLFQNFRFNHALTILENNAQKSEQKKNACNTALSSYVKSFHETKRQHSESQTTIVAYQKNLSSLQVLIEKRAAFRKKWEEYQNKLDESMTSVRDSKKRKGRAFWKSVAKDLTKRNHYRQKVEDIDQEIDTQLKQFSSQLLTQKKSARHIDAPPPPKHPNRTKQ